MIEEPDLEKYRDFVNTSQVKVRFIDGKGWYKPYPYLPEEK